jgi:hypothetical protein
MNNGSNNNHDDDSVTTFGLRSTCKSINLLEDDSDDDDDDAESAPPPRRQKETKRSPFVSPATQTLNVLSQNMDDLRYNMMSSTNDLLGEEEEKQVHEEENNKKKKNVKNKSSTFNHNTTTDSASHNKEPRSSLSTKTAAEKVNASTAATRTTTQPTNTIEPAAKSHAATTRKTNSTMISAPITTTTKHANTSTSHDIINYWWEGCKADWQLIPITIEETDGVLGMVLQNSSFPAFTGTKEEGKHCKVLRIYQPSLAQRHGVQAGDWICRLEDGVPVLVPIQQVIEWSKQRPFHIHLLRAKQPRDEEPTSLPVVGNIKTFDDATSCASETATKKVSSKTNVVDHVSHDHHHDDYDSSISVASVSTTNRASSALLLLAKRPKNKSSPFWNNSQQQKSSTNKEHETIISQPYGNTLSRKRDSNGRSIVVPREKPPSGSSTAKKTPTPPPSSSNRENAKSNDNNDLFCRRCHPKNKKMPRMHHAWCRLNQFFENSGAMDLVKRIRQGARLGCQACETEFSTGKLTHQKHLGACSTNQKRLKKLIEARECLEEEEEEKRKQRKRGKPSPKKKDTGSRQKRKQPDIVLSPPSSDDEEDEDMDEISVLLPKRKRGRIHTISVGQASSGRGSSKPKTSDASRATRPKDSQGEESPNTMMVTPQPPSESATGHQRGREAIKPNWITCSDNPWGSEGYTIGDVLLYGPQLGLGHFETVLPSERYVMDPFALSSTYRSTHCTPQEGLAILSLRRDTLATRPWGFRVGLDEFGRGCLVESVTPMSPAVAAVSSSRFDRTQIIA